MKSSREAEIGRARKVGDTRCDCAGMGGQGKEGVGGLGGEPVLKRARDALESQVDSTWTRSQKIRDCSGERMR